MSGENKESKKENRWCRSAICGSDPFIPDSEFAGDDCQLTCDIKKEKK